jgi:riboflavin synthase
MEDLKVSESISVNGTCLTVVATTKETFTVDLSPETLRRTNLCVLKAGSGVNLERSLAVGGRMGGHIVQGHVDGTGRFLRSIPEGQEMWMMWFSAPERLMPYIVEKGFIAVDGISLTVVNREGTSFSIAVIPYTLNNTVLKERKPGDPVNIEVDILAKYVESLLKGERFTGSETTSS